MSTAEAEPDVREPEPEPTGEGAAGENPENPEEPVAGPSRPGLQLDEEYGDIHKIVLQGLLAAGFLDTKGVKKLFVGACTYLKLDQTERTTMPYVQRIVREINDKVKTYDMAIKSASCEFTGRKFYIFLITVENSIFKMQTLFSKFELELFQKCMDAILRKYNNYSVPLTECMNFAKDCEAKGSLQEAEGFILRMIRTKYLAKNMINATEFHVTMGFRGLREFEPLLKELYHEVVSSCNLCKMVLLHGLYCPNCRVLVHKHCFLKFIRTSKECPQCKIPWTKPGVKEEPIQMIKKIRDTAGDPSARPPASQVDPQHVSGDEEEGRENPPVPVAGAAPVTTAAAPAAVGVSVPETPQETNVEQEEEEEIREDEEEEEEEGDEEENEEEIEDVDEEVEGEGVAEDEEEVEGEYNEGEEDEDEEQDQENADEDEEGEEGENDEDENVEYEGEGDLGDEDQEEGEGEENVADEENVEYENEDEEEGEQAGDAEDDEENEEGGEDDEQNEEVVGEEEQENEENEEEEEEEEVAINVEPPPTPSIRRSTRVSTRTRQGLNLSESDSD